jgi:short-subunit dehydrogenase
MSKKIWITGASSGIGNSLAIKFANEGWQVAASARRKVLLEDLNKINPNIHSFPLDVIDSENVKKTFESILKKMGELDLCVFSTGTYEPKLEKEINEKQIRNVMEINFFGTVNCIKAVEDYFKNKKSGHISVVSSVSGYRGLPNSTGYGASKAALINLTESLYLDFNKHNVRVSLISPGFIKTPMTDKNNFKMPFIRSSEFAAEKIYIGLTKSTKFEITFPKQLTIILKILRILPYWIYFYLVGKLTKYQKR